MARLVITTDKQEFVILNTTTGKIEHEQPNTGILDCPEVKDKGRHTFRPFGIAQDTFYFYVASNTKIVGYRKSSYSLANLNPIEIKPLYVNTHQILKNNSTWYVCNTAIDCISIYSGDKVVHFNVNLLHVVDDVIEPINADLLDSRHVNTLYDAGDKIYFCRHNKGYGESDFGYFDKATFEARIVAKAGKWCHGIGFINKSLYTLSTMTGELLKIDLDSNIVAKYKLVDPDITFLRGFDIKDNKMFIGASNNFKTNEGEKLCFVLVFDLLTGKFSRHNLPNSDCINDLKVLS